MLPDWVSNPGPLTCESGALPTALHFQDNHCSLFQNSLMYQDLSYQKGKLHLIAAD